MFGCIPRVSSEAVGSDHSKSIAICCTVSLIAPKLIFKGLQIFSMSSSLTIVDPKPACTQNTLWFVDLSLTTAPKGSHSKRSFIFQKTLPGSSIFSPRRLVHSAPNPRYLLTFLSSWFPLSMKIYFGYFSFSAKSKQSTSRLWDPLSTQLPRKR